MDMKNTIGHLNVSAFDKARPMAPSLGEILVASGRLPADAVSRVAARQQERGIPFGEAAVELGLVTSADVQGALASQFDYPVLRAGDQGVDPELVAAFEPDSPRVEALRKLRSQLVLRRMARPLQKTVAIVGASRGEGRSWLAANLAVVFSQLGERTLLIDGDLRFPRQQSLFRMSPAGGGWRRVWPSAATADRFRRMRALPTCRCCRPASCRRTPRSCSPVGPLRRSWRRPGKIST